MSQLKVTILVEVIKVYKPTKRQVWTTKKKLKAIHKQAKVNISVCLLNREVHVKATKFCIGQEELVNVYKLAKFE